MKISGNPVIDQRGLEQRLDRIIALLEQLLKQPWPSVGTLPSPVLPSQGFQCGVCGTWVTGGTHYCAGSTG